jgi:methylmalonyl-CoA mutase C-terminal domain/subunit
LAAATTEAPRSIAVNPCRSRDAVGRLRTATAARPTIAAMTDHPIKVLIAKPGLDGHDRGAKVLARGLRDEGFEVVYTGLRQTPEMIATAALQEDVDVVGLSILSGAHMTLVPRVTRLLAERGMDDVLVTVGGIIPDDDVPALRAAGVAEIFGPGTTIAEVANFLRANARSRE